MRKIFCIAALLAFALPAFAAPNSRAKREAKRHFDKAETEYKLGRFEQALEHYQKAYEVLPEPAFLFNIGQCHRNMGDLDRALYFFRSFLDAAKDPVARARVERLIAEIEAKQEEERRAEEARARQRAETATLAPAIAEVPTATRASTIVATAPPETKEEGVPAWPFILAAVVAAVGGGIAIAVVASRGGGSDDGLIVDWRDR